jgi:hypothetical protein
MLVLNHFHSVKNFLFSAAKPRDFDEMLGTGHPVSLYTTKTPIDKRRFNITQQEFFYNFCKRQISNKLFYLYQTQRLQCTHNYFFKIKFVLFLHLLLSVMKGKRSVLIYFCYQTDKKVQTPVFTQPFSWRLHITITYNLLHLRHYVDIVTIIA